MYEWNSHELTVLKNTPSVASSMKSKSVLMQLPIHNPFVSAIVKDNRAHSLNKNGAM